MSRNMIHAKRSYKVCRLSQSCIIRVNSLQCVYRSTNYIRSLKLARTSIPTYYYIRTNHLLPITLKMFAIIKNVPLQNNFCQKRNVPHNFTVTCYCHIPVREVYIELSPITTLCCNDNYL